MNNENMSKDMAVVPQSEMTDTQLKILDTIKQNFDVEKLGEITTEILFNSIGLDSITFIKMIVMLEDDYNFEFDDEKLMIEEFPTVKSMIDYVETKII